MGCKDEDKVYEANRKSAGISVRVCKCSFVTSRHGGKGQGVQLCYRSETLGVE